MSSPIKNSARGFDWRNLIKGFLTDQQKQQTVINPLDTKEFKRHSRALEDICLCADQGTTQINYLVANPNARVYLLPYEPDGRYLTVWWRLSDFGGENTKVNDWSGYDNHGQVSESVNTGEGHAQHLKSLTLDGDNGYIFGEDHPSNNWQNLTVGGSFVIWINPQDIQLSGGKPQIIGCKVNDSPDDQDSAWVCWVEPTGTVFFSVVVAGVAYTAVLPQAITVLKQWYLVVCTFDKASNTPRVYVNGISSTTSSNSTSIVPPLPSPDIGKRFMIGWNGYHDSHFLFAEVDDIQLWTERVLTQAEITAKWTNKYTILNIAYPFFAGHAELPQIDPNTGEIIVPTVPANVFSFSPISFSPDSFSVDRGTDGQGGGSVDGLTPGNFLDDFRGGTYSLINANDISPNLYWKLIQAPGAGGFVRTEDYSVAGELASRILRLRRGTADPIVETNTYVWGDLYLRCQVRTIAQTAAGSENQTLIIFKRQDSNNYYYVVLAQHQIIVRRVINGGALETYASTPTTTNIFPVGQNSLVEIELMDDSNTLIVTIDGETTHASKRLTVSTGGVPSGTVLNAIAKVAFQAKNADVGIDNVLIRPMFGDDFQSAVWSLTTASSTSPDGRWILQVAPGTGGQARTFDYGATGAAQRALNLKSGTVDPILLTNTLNWRNHTVICDMRTVSQLVVSQNNRAQLIFKWKDASNFHYLVLYPTGVQWRRLVSGVDALVSSSTAVGFADNTYHKVEVRVYNDGKDVDIYINNVLRLSNHDWVNGPSAVDDNGILSYPTAKVGFRAVQSDCSFDNVRVKPN